jgi:hypothetical protein
MAASINNGAVMTNRSDCVLKSPAPSRMYMNVASCNEGNLQLTLQLLEHRKLLCVVRPVCSSTPTRNASLCDQSSLNALEINLYP